MSKGRTKKTKSLLKSLRQFPYLNYRSRGGSHRRPNRSFPVSPRRTLGRREGGGSVGRLERRVGEGVSLKSVPSRRGHHSLFLSGNVFTVVGLEGVFHSRPQTPRECLGPTEGALEGLGEPTQSESKSCFTSGDPLLHRKEPFPYSGSET